jgi:lipopolysaccharide transport system ATP-binding protein
MLQKSTTITSKTDVASSQAVVKLDKVGLFYRRNWFRSVFSRQRYKKGGSIFWALRDISFEVYQGEALGFIGRNGSGKTTCLYLINQVYQPDEGSVTTCGKVQMLTVGLGFKPELTGRENIRISSALLGINQQTLKLQIDDIIDFADIGSFIDEPVRTYSAGMRSRLGFAISTAIEPDILLVDEAMAPGDAAFRKKAVKRLESVLDRSGTIILVSHSPATLKKVCTRLVWMEKGSIIMEGPTESVLSDYADFAKHPHQWLKDHDKYQDGRQ